MARFGVSITKRAAFRDSLQEWANVYHYTYVGLNPSAASAESVIDAIVAIEKTFHSTSVSFVSAKAWEADGTAGENIMITEKLLTGTGATAPIAFLDRERAMLVQWPAGVDSRGHPVTLKKWFHTCGVIPGVAISDNIAGNTTGFTEANRTAIEGLVDDLTELTSTGLGLDLCSASGRVWEDNVRAHKYLEHHQLGDQWRG